MAKLKDIAFFLNTLHHLRVSEYSAVKIVDDELVFGKPPKNKDVDSDIFIPERMVFIDLTKDDYNYEDYFIFLDFDDETLIVNNCVLDLKEDKDIVYKALSLELKKSKEMLAAMEFASPVLDTLLGPLKELEDVKEQRKFKI